MLNKAAEELPSESDVDKADDVELQGKEHEGFNFTVDAQMIYWNSLYTSC